MWALAQWVVIETQRLLHREDGQDLAEYALLIGMISVLMIATLQSISGILATLLTRIVTTLASA
jgi:Flp pilus assembly pilin Flp